MEITHNLKKCMADMFQNISGVDRSSLKEDRKAIFQAYYWLLFPQFTVVLHLIMFIRNVYF